MLNSRHYSKQSQHFDLEYQKSSEHINDIASRNEVEMFLKFTGVTPSTHTKVLDVGAGSGRFTIHLLDMGFNVTATEISPESLKKISEQAISIDKRENLTTILDSLEKATFKDEFDFVFCVNLLHHVENMGHVFKNMHEATKPGGKLAIIEPNPLNPLFYIDFYRKRNWEIEKGILRCRRRNLIKLFDKYNLKNVKYKRYVLIPNTLQYMIPGFGMLNELLLKIPIINKFYMFHIIYGEK